MYSKKSKNCGKGVEFVVDDNSEDNVQVEWAWERKRETGLLFVGCL